MRDELNRVIRENNLDEIKKILISHYDILNEVRYDMMLPLNLALLYSNDETVLLLLSMGADPRVIDSDGLTPFYSVVWNNRISLINSFLSISKDYIDEMINLAANKGYTLISSVLLDNGAELEAWRINDLFYLSCLRGESEYLEIFIHHGAQLNYEKDEVNVITGALRNKHKNVLIELVRLGCDDIGDESTRQIIDKNFWFSSINNEDLDMVRHYIAKYGRSSIYAINENNKNSLDIACEKDNFELFNILYNVVKPLVSKNKKKLEKIAQLNGNIDILNLIKIGKN